MSFLDKPTLSADNGSFLQKNLVYQTEKPTLPEINLLYLIIVTTACHRQQANNTNERNVHNVKPIWLGHNWQGEDMNLSNNTDWCDMYIVKLICIYERCELDNAAFVCVQMVGRFSK